MARACNASKTPCVRDRAAPADAKNRQQGWGFLVISVIIPCFNASETLAEAVASLPSPEERPAGHDLEIILADDGSTDGADGLIRDLAARDVRIVTLFNGENRGVSYTRNAALRRARGDLVIFLDSDDKFAPGALELLASHMTPDVDFVRGKHLLWDSATGALKPNEGDEYNTVELLAVEPTAYPQMTTLYTSWNALMRREVIRKNKLEFDEELRIGEDRLFNFQYLMASRKMTTLGAYTYLWRRHPGEGRQATQVLVKQADPMIDSIYKAVRLLEHPWFAENPAHRSWLATGMLVEFCNNLAAFSSLIETDSLRQSSMRRVEDIIATLQPAWILPERYSVKGYRQIFNPLYEHIARQSGKTPDEGVLKAFFRLLGRLRRSLPQANGAEGGGAPKGSALGANLLAEIYRAARSRRAPEAIALERTIIEQSRLFDPGYYRAVHNDVAASGIDAVVHFLDFGAAEMRNPNSWFNTQAYFERHPHLVIAGVNPLSHYAMNAD